MVRALAPVPGFLRRGATRRIALVLLVGVVVLVALVLAAGSARAAGSWTSSQGSFTMESNPGDCTGSGIASIWLNSTGSGLSGSITVTLENVASFCAWAFATGPVTAQISGTMNADGSGFQATDSEGDSFVGTYSGSTLSVTMTLGGATSGGGGGGGVCAEYCTTVYSFTFTGSGDLFSGSFSNVLEPVAAVFGGALGAVGVGQGAASARRPPIVPKGGGGPGTTAYGVPPGASSPSSPPPAGWQGSYWTATPPNPPPRYADMTPGYPITADNALPISGGGAFVGPPDYYTIPGGQPPPNSETDPRTGKLLCPIHGTPVHPKWVSYGPARPFLRWECPVGPHLPWG